MLEKTDFHSAQISVFSTFFNGGCTAWFIQPLNTTSHKCINVVMWHVQSLNWPFQLPLFRSIYIAETLIKVKSVWE